MLMLWKSVTAAVVTGAVLSGGLAEAARHERTLAIVMTNDAKANAVKVYDAESGAILQTLPTLGQGGVDNNAHGVRQFDGTLVAAVNFGSNSVAMYRRDHDALHFDGLVYTTSAPVSVDFGNGHMYVAGTSTVDSFPLHGAHVGALDGTTTLRLADGAIPPVGSTAQVGVVDERQLLVTLKADPDPGTVDVVALRDGAIVADVPNAVSAPAGSLTPFGFSVYPDGSALITLAHSNQNGVFREGHFVAVVNSTETASCWTVLFGKYVFVGNTASRTISRLIGTGSHAFIDAAVATSVPTGNPLDLDVTSDLFATVDHGAGTSHISVFRVNAFGELAPALSPIDVGTPAANGIALMSATRRDN